MGLISNLFTESEFDDYRFIEKVLREADNDDEDNFDMPDDNTDDNENQPDNTPEPEDGNASNDDNAGDESSDEDNFDMPDDTTDPQSDEGVDTQSMDNPDPQSTDTPDSQSNDTSGESGDEDNFDLPDDDTGGQAQDANGGDTTGDQSTDDDMSGGDDDNFDMDDSTADSGDGTADDMSGDNAGDMSGGEDPDQDLKDAENDIFNGLSDQDKVIKINELKDLYQDLYNRIITLYDKVNDIPKDDELIKVYNFVIDNLSDLKQFVYDYLTNTFDNKTYLENMVNYKKYLSTLNVINGILEEIRKGLYKESGN